MDLRIRIRGSGSGSTPKYHGFASLTKTVNSIDQKIRVFCPINVQELHLRIDCGFLKSTSRNDCEQHWAKHSSLLWNCCPSFWFSTLVYWGSGFGSGSVYFHHWPSRCQQKLNFLGVFSEYYFLTVLLNHLSKVKSQKEVTKQYIQGLSYYFCLTI